MKRQQVLDQKVFQGRGSDQLGQMVMEATSWALTLGRERGESHLLPVRKGDRLPAFLRGLRYDPQEHGQTGEHR